METNKYQKILKMARGIIRSELVLKNATIFMSHTGEFVEGDISVADGKILGVGTYEGEIEIDLEGKYVTPGFIDSHLHLESTLVTPKELICQAVQCGTTTFIVDPHESANVMGNDGIDYILEETKDVTANVYLMLPSCVPSTTLEEYGCKLLAHDMKKYERNDRILGLGEVMDTVSVINGESSMLDKLELFKDKIKDGHAPFLSEKELATYVFSGITTDHECVDFNYALKECRNGMYVLIREGSAARNLEAIVKGIVNNNVDCRNFCFCTDDKHIEEIQKEGHINFNVKRAVELGLPLKSALQIATIHAATCYGLKHLGAIAPGYQADFIVFEDMKTMNIHSVFHKGKKIKKDQVCEITECNIKLRQSIKIKEFNRNQLKLKHLGTKAHILEMQERQIMTRHVIESVPWYEEDGENYFKTNRTYQKIAVINRYKEDGEVGVGIVKGFGLVGGAIASSVSHDSHNIIVVGDNDADMELAVRELIRTQGGYTIVTKGHIFKTLPMPIMGLMSDLGYKKVKDILSEMIPKAHEMGVADGIDPFITLSFMALPVIPEIRIMPKGIFIVEEDKILRTPFG
ncbi:MAG: adenine deaminase [Lachnospiraceae bacterium]